MTTQREAGEAARAEGFEDFVRTTGHRVLASAVLLCAQPRAAGDLAQATYATVFAGWRRVRGVRDPVVATRTIMTRTSLAGPAPAEARGAPVVSVPDSGQTPGRPPLLDALAHLSARDRAVLVLQYWESRGLAEVAADLAVSASACRTSTARALGRLRTDRPDLATAAQLRACMDDAVDGTTADLDQLARGSRQEGMRLRRYRHALSTVGAATVGAGDGD